MFFAAASWSALLFYILAYAFLKNISFVVFLGDLRKEGLELSKWNVLKVQCLTRPYYSEVKNYTGILLLDPHNNSQR